MPSMVVCWARALAGSAIQKSTQGHSSKIKMKWLPGRSAKIRRVVIGYADCSIFRLSTMLDLTAALVSLKYPGTGSWPFIGIQNNSVQLLLSAEMNFLALPEHADVSPTAKD